MREGRGRGGEGGERELGEREGRGRGEAGEREWRGRGEAE